MTDAAQCDSPPQHFAPATLAAMLGVVTVLLFVAALMVGPAGIGLPGDTAAARLILTEIRLPRAILATLIGAALGLGGAVLQGYLRNPLAEPGLLGVSGGAALGAVLAIHTGAAAAFALALPLAGLAGAAATTGVLLALSTGGGTLTLILAGVALAAITNALIALALNLAPNPFASVEITFWLLGSLTDRSLVHVWVAAPPIVAGSALLFTTGRALDALSLGEDGAANLGVNLGRLRLAVITGIALAVGAATSVTGVIGFVGLVVPHVVRPLIGYEPGRLLLPSALGGAALLLAADVGLRLAAPLSDLRIGVVTSLIGAPFFLWLVLATRKELAP